MVPSSNGGEEVPAKVDMTLVFFCFSLRRRATVDQSFRANGFFLQLRDRFESLL